MKNLFKKQSVEESNKFHYVEFLKTENEPVKVIVTENGWKAEYPNGGTVKFKDDKYTTIDDNLNHVKELLNLN